MWTLQHCQPTAEHSTEIQEQVKGEGKYKVLIAVSNKHGLVRCIRTLNGSTMHGVWDELCQLSGCTRGPTAICLP